MLGNAANMLPSSVLESLTTAELLFHKYANENYANIGFDYSCISSLYFQAFARWRHSGRSAETGRG